MKHLKNLFWLIVLVALANWLFNTTHRDTVSTPAPAPASGPATAKPPPAPTCREDWHACTDNADLVNNWRGWYGVKWDCKKAANDLAKYGDPEWPWFAFGRFRGGTDYVRTGKVLAVETEAKFSNGFGAKARVQVYCTYNLNTAKVEDINIVPR